MNVSSEKPAAQAGNILKHKYRNVVPWRNPEQFRKVYENLYSSCVTRKRWAVDQVTEWETRCHPSLPAAIEATVVIVGSVIQEMLFDVGQTFLREREIQTMFSMSLVRFVNLILEIDGKRNLTLLAEERNIPRWIIDLRHDASHATLPALPLLRMGIQIALAYLKESFWLVELAKLRPIIMPPSQVEEKVFNLIAKFKEVQFLRLDNLRDKVELEKELENVVEKIRNLVSSCNTKFVEVFVKPGVFLCPEELMMTLRVSDPMFLEDDDFLILPDILQKYWLPIFRILHTFELISYFVEMLLLSQENCRNMLCNKTAVVWAMHLLNSTSPCFKSKLSQRFKATGVQLYLYRLLYASIIGINKFTPEIFAVILQHLGESENEKYTELCKIIAIQHCILNSEDTAKQGNKDEIYTLEEVENDINRKKRQQQGFPKEDNIWSLAPININFSELPLGEIIYPVDHVLKKDNAACEDEVMDTDIKEEFILVDENYNKEPKVEVKSTSDTKVSLEKELSDMIYR